MLHCADVSFGVGIAVAVVIILVVVIVVPVLTLFYWWKFFNTFIKHLGTFL